MAALLLTARVSIAQNFNFQLRSTMDFPGQTLANVCGYWQNGQEYALLGGSLGLIIVDITNPASPQQIVQIPGPNNLWKEIKVYGHYAYVTTEGGSGLQIVNLSGLPGSNLPSKFYTGDGAISGQLDEIHALHIDVTKGFLYLFGGNLFGGAAKVFDLKPDPYNPKYVGSFTDLGYIHDGFADNDTLYACHIEAGLLSAVDMSDKSNPVLLGTVQTPGKFTHNAWITSDRKHVLTTDEATPSFLASYDVSDPSNMEELDRVSPNNGYGSYVHNTHILNDYAVTSWYTDGVLTVDAHRPQNLVIVGRYDTWAASNLAFDGCWGTFPFFPSGTVITSDIDPGQLTVLTPTYQRACYLEGRVFNACNGQPLAGATVRINGSSDPQKVVVTKANGIYRTGQRAPGNFTVTVSAPGFPPQTINITLATGVVTELDVVLDIGPATDIFGTVTEAGTNAAVPGAVVTLVSPITSYTLTSNGLGQFNLNCIPAGNYVATAGKWGYLDASVSVVPNTPTLIQLQKGYYDDFGLDLGWTTGGTATRGFWEWGEPDGTQFWGTIINPDTDAPGDNNDLCYVTGNGGGQPGNDDVDDGFVSLISPVMKLAGFQDAIFSFYFWFYNGGGSGTPNDRMQVNLLKGAQTIPLLTITESQSAWRYSGEINLGNFTTMSDNMRIEFIVRDDNPGHLVEGAVDIFRVQPVVTTKVGHTPDETAFLAISPNPTLNEFTLRYTWENAESNPVLEVHNLLGQLVHSQRLSGKDGTATFGQNWVPGVYSAKLLSNGRTTVPIKLVKQ